MEHLQAIVQRVDDLAQGVRAFEFAPATGSGPFPSAQAGAHIDLKLGNGLVRSYSLFEPASGDSPYRIAVALDEASRGGSRFLFDQVRVGQGIEISPPKNHFTLEEDVSHTVLVAGGIGITPLWAMVQRLESLGRSWSLHYAARRRDCAAFVDELERFAQASTLGVLFTSFGDDPQRQRIDLASVFANAPHGAHFYCCGPKRLIEDFVKHGESRPPEHVHVEHFEGVQPTGGDMSYTVRLVRSDKVLTVPAGKTILEVVESAGIEVAHACKEGVCAACEVRVIGGIPDHRDLVLSRKEKAQNQSMMICCSGALSPELVLDL